MTSATVEQIAATAKANADAMNRRGNAADQALRANAESPARRGNGADQADRIIGAGKADIVALTESAHSALAGFQELASAYQGLAARNAERLSVSIQAFAAVKTPAEFIELQQKLINESVDAAAHDWSNIAKLTLAVFIGAFEPIQNQAQMLQFTMKK
jgi:hypothetical protein